MTKASFLNGSIWIRADFHLQTKADKEFRYFRRAEEFYGITG